MEDLAQRAAGKAGKYRFGLDRDNTIRVLRELADRMENHSVSVVCVEHFTKADPDDFTITSLTVQFAECLEGLPGADREGEKAASEELEKFADGNTGAARV